MKLQRPGLWPAFLENCHPRADGVRFDSVAPGRRAGGATRRAGGRRSSPAARSTARARAPRRPRRRPGAPASRSDNPDVTVNYDPVGSGGGREQFLAGGVALRRLGRRVRPTTSSTGAKKRCGGADPSRSRPTSRPIAVVYNLDGRRQAQLSPRHASPRSSTARSPTGTTRRSRPTTPTPSCPSDRDHPGPPLRRVGHDRELHRLPEQGRRRTSGPYEADGDWPIKGGEAAQGTSGVVAAVKAARAPSATPTRARPATWASPTIKVGDAVRRAVRRGRRQGRSTVSEGRAGRGANDIAHRRSTARRPSRAPTRSCSSSYRIACPSTTTPNRPRWSRAT